MVDADKVRTMPAGRDVPANWEVIRIEKEQDIARARREARVLAEDLGFSPVTAMHVLIAVTELATNLHIHALPGGEVFLGEVREQDDIGIEIIAVDRGPGINDIDLAMQDRYSTAGSMGCGLPAVKRLMDEFEISSRVDKGAGCGTTVTARKWRR